MEQEKVISRAAPIVPIVAHRREECPEQEPYSNCPNQTNYYYSHVSLLSFRYPRSLSWSLIGNVVTGRSPKANCLANLSAARRGYFISLSSFSIPQVGHQEISRRINLSGVLQNSA